MWCTWCFNQGWVNWRDSEAAFGFRLSAVGSPMAAGTVFPKVDTPYGQALTGLRVQAPLGARILSFVCCAPNDGFSPQSGLVQRGVLYAACGGSKTVQPPFGRRKCIPPLVAGATTLPGGKHVTGFAGRLQLPYESSSFATPASGGSPAKPDRGRRAQRANLQNAYHAI